MKRFRIYARLSLTKGDDVSITRQLQFGHDALRECQLAQADVIHDCSIDDYVEDKGTRSGRTQKHRPRFRQLLTDIERAASPAILWTYDIARLTRGDDTMLLLMQLRALKQEVIAHRDEINLETFNGRSMVRFKGLWNAIESDQASDRITRYYDGARKAGWVYHRRPPLGLLLSGTKSKRRFITDPVTFPLVLSFCKLIAESHTIRDAARLLAAKGFRARTRAGMPRPLDYWHLQQVLAKLPLYKPFLPATLYAQCSRRYAELSSRAFHGVKSKTAPGIFSRLLMCIECGQRWGHLVERPHDEYPNYAWRGYRHSGTSLCGNHHKVAAHKLESQLWTVLDPFIERLSHTDFGDPVATAARRKEKPARDIRRELEILDTNFRTAIALPSFSPAVAEQFNREREQLEADSRTQPKPSPVLSPDEIRALAVSAPTFHKLAEIDPARFNIILRDIFMRIEIDRKNRLKFVPREEFAALF